VRSPERAISQPWRRWVAESLFENFERWGGGCFFTGKSASRGRGRSWAGAETSRGQNPQFSRKKNSLTTLFRGCNRPPSIGKLRLSAQASIRVKFAGAGKNRGCRASQKTKKLWRYLNQHCDCTGEDIDPMSVPTSPSGVGDHNEEPRVVAWHHWPPLWPCGGSAVFFCAEWVSAEWQIAGPSNFRPIRRVSAEWKIG